MSSAGAWLKAATDAMTSTDDAPWWAKADTDLKATTLNKQMDGELWARWSRASMPWWADTYANTDSADWWTKASADANTNADWWTKARRTPMPTPMPIPSKKGNSSKQEGGWVGGQPMHWQQCRQQQQSLQHSQQHWQREHQQEQLHQPQLYTQQPHQWPLHSGPWIWNPEACEAFRQRLEIMYPARLGNADIKPGNADIKPGNAEVE